MATDFMSNGANHNCTITYIKFVGRFCETPTQQMASDTDALQLSRGTIGPVRHIYVHIPFCARICPYCAFYKDLLDRSQTQRFCEAILQELAGRDHSSLAAARARRLFPFTIYFGGGTPTALNIAQLEMLLRGFRERLDLSQLIEWS